MADTADAKLIVGIIQRCGQILSQDDLQVLSRCYGMLMAETVEYLGLNPEGQLIGIEDQQESPAEPQTAPVTDSTIGEGTPKKTIMRKVK